MTACRPRDRCSKRFMVRMAAGICTVHSFLPWQETASVYRELRASHGNKGWLERQGMGSFGLSGRQCGGGGAKVHTLWVKPCRLSWVLPTTRLLCTRTSPTGWALNSMQYLGCLESLWNKDTIPLPREALRLARWLIYPFSAPQINPRAPLVLST